MGSVSRHMRTIIIASVLLLLSLWSLPGSKRTPASAKTALSVSGNHGVPSPLPGSLIKSLGGRAIEGGSITVELSHSGHETLIFVLSPVCPYCKVNFHYWRELLSEEENAQPLWLDMTGTADENYLQTFGITHRFPVVLSDPQTCSRYQIIGTPTTILVDEKGVVQWSHAGPLTEDLILQAKHLMHSTSTATSVRYSAEKAQHVGTLNTYSKLTRKELNHEIATHLYGGIQ